MTAPDPLDAFHPRIAAWFRERHGAPTAVQALAWPVVAAGEHVLATAPTGSGKTLCAFLVPLERLLTGAWSAGTVRVVYVSPLKALNNDVRRNLLEPLAELAARWEADGEPAPRIRVATRSGDTPQEERRRMQRDPPEILVTTPESLNILLTSAGGRAMLGDVRMVILDEIHAVAGSRRGTWLMSGVEALAARAGEFQRVALSATVRPLEDVAAFVGGHAPGPDGAPALQPRPVRILRAPADKRVELAVRALEPDPLPDDGGLDGLAPIARAVVAATARNRATLVFANSRALCEKLAARVNEAAPPGSDGPLAWAHHGSLSRELRLEVEARLKAGELKAIVATSSLELGIDIGALDEVVLVQTPPSVAAALQRAGRAGHQVGAVSRAVLHPTHPHDLLEAAVLAPALLERDLEPTEPPAGGLDVLAQVLVARLAAGPADPDALFDAVRCAAPYRALRRDHFDLVVAMLAGRYADSRVRELQPRLLEDPHTGRLSLRRGATLALYGSGGVIPDRGYYQLRHAESQVRIGELDEEFVWENGPGSAFSLGSQPWRVQRVTHNDVFVTPAPDATRAPPFWRAEERARDPHLSARLETTLEQWEAALGPRSDRAALEALLAETTPLDGPSRTTLVEHLVRQREATGAPLPHARQLVVERVRSGPGGYGGDGGQLVIHCFAGRRHNRTWALALEAAWEARFGERPEVYAADDALAVQLGGDVAPEEVLALVPAAELEGLVRRRIEGSGFFGARFRECAGRALLFTRQRFGERLPLWMSRLQSQKLLARVRRYGDFPVLLEAWRSCLVEDLDLPALRARLEALEAGEIAVTHVTTATPSPFAAEPGWAQINRYMYADDTPRGSGVDASGLRPSLLETVLGDDRLRPRVRQATVEDFLLRRRRLAPGWRPTDGPEFDAWLRERRLLSEEECARHAAAAGVEIGSRVARLRRDDRVWCVHAADAATAAALFPAAVLDPPTAPARLADPETTRLAWLRDWIAFEAPATAEALAEAWPGEALLADLRVLADEGALVHGPLLEGDETPRFADVDNLEAMLRQQRARARRSVPTLPAALVPAFLASWQRVGECEDGYDALEALRGLPLAAADWEGAVLPARLEGPAGDALDAVLAGEGLVLYGHGHERLAFALRDELEDLPRPAGAPDPEVETRLAAAFPDPAARYPFEALREACGGDAVAAAETLWAGLWGGRLSTDSFAAVRHGLAHRFTLPKLAADGDGPGPLRRRGSLRARVRSRVAGVPGRFFRLPEPAAPEEHLDALERARRRARVALERWGVVTPALLRREAPGLRWKDLFPALRLLELAGEVTSGLFLDGLDGPQFATPEAAGLVTRLAEEGAGTILRWLDARDPASPCGLGLSPAGLPLPERRGGNGLLLRGAEVVLVTERSGRCARIAPAPEDPALDAVLEAWARVRERRAGAPRELARINDAPARTSPWLPALRHHFDVAADHRSLVLAPRRR
ncbi:MAG: DEAD/DEAH box helicase [Pseudomonadales bacterium]|jgi:ATP-dependent Lhr-like helicase|nr:DEAD/DEAH box helicase [Pseudomonadales bacterium]